MSKILIAKINPIDVTTLINEGLPKSWRCPHCWKRNKTGQYKEEELLKNENKKIQVFCW